MDSDQMFGLFNNRDILSLLFKLFAIVISCMYLIYSFVISSQTQIINKTIESKNSYILSAVAKVQISLAFILLILAIFLL